MALSVFINIASVIYASSVFVKIREMGQLMFDSKAKNAPSFISITNVIFNIMEKDGNTKHNLNIHLKIN